MAGRRSGRDEVAVGDGAGVPVVFFPEGTTTNGEQTAAVPLGAAGADDGVGEQVTASYLRYSLGEGNGPGVTVQNDVGYWGDMSMGPHVFRLLGLRNVRAEVWFADGPIEFSWDDLHRKKAAVEARAAVRELRDKATAVPGIGLVVSMEERNG